MELTQSAVPDVTPDDGTLFNLDADTLKGPTKPQSSYLLSVNL